MAAGQKVLFARIGAVLPGDFKIKKSKILGVESFGMICAEDELGIGVDHSGIIVLPESSGLVPGDDPAAFLGLGDEVLDGDLISFLEQEAGLEAHSVAGWDLMTYPVEAPAYLGRDRELVAGPCRDNRRSVHAGAAGLAAAATSGAPLTRIPVLAAFDHEENGSQSDTGADGPLLGSVLERSVFARGGTYEDRARALAGTVCLSSDTGHAVHPNYAERHDPTHHPRVNGGPILKVNVNNRYATDGSGRAVFAAASSALVREVISELR